MKAVANYQSDQPLPGAVRYPARIHSISTSPSRSPLPSASVSPSSIVGGPPDASDRVPPDRSVTMMDRAPAMIDGSGAVRPVVQTCVRCAGDPGGDLVGPSVQQRHHVVEVMGGARNDRTLLQATSFQHDSG